MVRDQDGDMQLYSLRYTSSAIYDLSHRELSQILETSRTRNSVHDITGVLLYVDGRFMQYLEGPKDGLQEVMEHIQASQLHRDLDIQPLQAIAAREYEGWSMAFMSPEEPAQVSPLSDYF